MLPTEKTPLIRINFDLPEKIDELFGIGLILAKRIVEYRTNNGYFRVPDDLAKVDGIKLNLATTLSPHIDWSVPAEQEPPEERSWSAVIVSFTGILACLYMMLNRSLPNIVGSLRHYQAGYPDAWISIWVDASVLAMQLCLAVDIALVMASALTTKQSQRRRFFRVSIAFAGLAILCGFSAGLGNAVYYQFYAPTGWQKLLVNQGALATVGAFVLLVLVVGPSLTTMWRPSLRFSVLLRRSYDTAMILASPCFAWAIWAFREKLPLWILIYAGIWGGVYAVFGLHILRTGESMFDAWFISSDTLGSIAKKSSWLAWLNARLPDPTDQKELKRALDEAYPPSRLRTIGGVVVLGAGAWLILTALSAVVQWIVERGLDQIFH